MNTKTPIYRFPRMCTLTRTGMQSGFVIEEPAFSNIGDDDGCLYAKTQDGAETLCQLIYGKPYLELEEVGMAYYTEWDPEDPDEQLFVSPHPDGRMAIPASTYDRLLELAKQIP